MEVSPGPVRTVMEVVDLIEKLLLKHGDPEVYPVRVWGKWKKEEGKGSNQGDLFRLFQIHVIAA